MGIKKKELNHQEKYCPKLPKCWRQSTYFAHNLYIPILHISGLSQKNLYVNPKAEFQNIL